MTKTINLSCVVFLLSSTVLLAGCQGHGQATQAQSQVSSPAVVPPPPVIALQPATSGHSSGAKNPPLSCQKELASLQKINPKGYAVKKVAYDRLVINASQYEGMRSDVNASTQDTVDAMYKYKMNMLCADIEHDVMQGLIRKGDAVK